MTSELAKGDLEDLRAAGLNPTDEDVIRLHALACRITDGQETNAANAPRWAEAGGVVFWEPTLAARYFFERACRLMESGDAEDWLFAFACANGRRVRYLETLTDRDEIERELGKFLASIAATKAEVERAVTYAALGYGSPVAEKTDLAKKHDEEKKGEISDPDEDVNALDSILQDAAAATGLTMYDLLGQTISRLVGMIYSANVRAGMTYSKTSKRAHAEYLATFAAIEKRLRAEKEAQQPSTGNQ